MGRKASQVIQVTLARERNAEFADSSLRPRALERPDCFLGRGAEAHRGIDQDVIEVAIAIEVEWQQVGVAMSSERPPLRVLSRQLRTVDASSAADSCHESAVQ
jgi:hypothetical protein